MAGSVKHDPAIDRWVDMRESYYKNFRFTSRTGLVAAVGLAVVPFGLYYILGQTTHMWDWGAKRKGESLRK